MTLWGSPNLSLEQGSPLGVGLCLAEEFFRPTVQYRQSDLRDGSFKRHGPRSVLPGIPRHYEPEPSRWFYVQPEHGCEGRHDLRDFPPEAFGRHVKPGKQQFNKHNSDYSVTISANPSEKQWHCRD